MQRLGKRALYPATNVWRTYYGEAGEVFYLDARTRERVPYVAGQAAFFVEVRYWQRRGHWQAAPGYWSYEIEALRRLDHAAEAACSIPQQQAQCATMEF